MSLFRVGDILKCKYTNKHNGDVFIGRVVSVLLAYPESLRSYLYEIKTDNGGYFMVDEEVLEFENPIDALAASGRTIS